MTSQYNANYLETMAFSDTSAQISAAVGTPQTWTVPGTNKFLYQALFEYPTNSNVYVGLNVTPIIGVLGSVGTQQYVEFRPQKRYVRGGDVLSFATPDTSAYFGVSLRQIQG